MMKKIDKAAMIIAKILEVVHWVAVGFTSLLLVAAFFARDTLNNLIEQGKLNISNATHMFSVDVINADGTFDYPILIIFAVSAIIVLILGAIMFRNIHSIFKSVKNGTPFRNEITRKVKFCGWLCISSTIVSLLASLVCSLFVAKSGGGNITVDVSGIIFGIFALCLSRIFGYGEKLQDEVDGLL